MNLFKSIIAEAISPKKFETEEDLHNKIVEILTASSVKAKRGSIKGYYMETIKPDHLHTTYSIKFSIGKERSWLDEIAIDLTKAGIKYETPNNDFFLIRGKDNVATEYYLSDEAKEEMETGKYNVVGMTIRSLNDINKSIAALDQNQQKIYKELSKRKFVNWQQTVLDKNKIGFQLTKI